MLIPLAESSKIRALHISQLNQLEIEDLAATVVNQPLSKAFVEQLARETGGNPLFILEILRALLERDYATNLEFPDHLPLTESLQQLIHTRLSHLKPDARRALEIAAVIGIDFDLEVLTEVGNFSSLDLSQSIDELIHQMLIEPLSTPPGHLRYQFIHSKIRDVLLHEISPLNLQLLEGKIAFALERHNKSQPAILAQHFELAGEATLAFKYWLQAGLRAKRLYSNADAIQAFQRAEKLIYRSPEITVEAIYDLFTEWTELAYVLEDDATIRRINTDLLSIGEMHDNKLLIGTALLGLSNACMVNNRFSDGLTFARRAIPYLENSGNLYAWMNAFIHKGVFEYMLGMLEESINDFQEALSIGVDSNNTRVLMASASAHYQIAFGRTLSGWPASGLNHASIALGDTSALGYQHGRVTAYSALALARYFLGEYRLASQESRVGIELAERLQAWRMLGYLHIYHAMSELALGNLDATIQSAQLGRQLGQKYGHTETTAVSYRLLGDVFFWLQDTYKAINYYQIAVQVSKDQFLAPDHQMRLGLTLILAGQDQAGQELLTQAIQTSKQTGLGILLILAQLSQSTAYIFRQDWDNAHKLTTFVYNEALRRSMPSVRLSAIQLMGEIAEHTGDPDTAGANYLKIIQEAASLQYVWIEISALKRLAHIHIQAGKPVVEIRQRLTHLFNELAPLAQNEIIRESFQRYIQSLQV